MNSIMNSFKKSQIKTNSLLMNQTSSSYIVKSKQKINLQSQLTFKQRLAIFKLRKKPRREIILRFSTITNGLQLPNLSQKDNLLRKQIVKNQVKSKFKIDQKDNLSNAKNYQERGNKISIPIKKTIHLDHSYKYTLNLENNHNNNKSISIETMRKPTNILQFQNHNHIRSMTRSNHSMCNFRLKNKNKSQNNHFKDPDNTFLNSNFPQFQQFNQSYSHSKSRIKKLRVQTVTNLDLQRTKNQFFNAKRMNQIHKQKLQLNKKLLNMEGMVYEKSEKVISNA